MTDAIPDVPPTIAELAFFAGGRYPKPDLIGRCGPSGLSVIGGRELVERVRDLGLGLASLGMQRGDRVAILSESRPEWMIADLAILAAGAVTTPIYPTLSAEQTGLILGDSEAVIAVVSNAVQLEKLASLGRNVPSLKAVVVMDPAVAPAAAAFEVVSFTEASARGHKQITDGWGIASGFHDEAKKVQPSDPATLIYTSGTTGPPKGVLLTHGNLTANIAGVRAVLHVDETDRALSFLPLSHAFERMVTYVYLTSGASILFAESIETVARDLKQVQPTIVTGVPRVFEKLQERIVAAGRAPGGIKRAIFDWSMGVADRRGACLSGQRADSSMLRLEAALADKLVFHKIRDVFGGRLRFAVSGGAPLRPDVGRYFSGAGVPVLEGYGLTETSPVMCVMPADRIRFGTVGPPLPNVEVRIADDGEVIVRGPSVMSGYYRRPEETATVIQDGWFHTGDIGRLDAEGYLHITDRKKELFVTSGGKKIAPSAIEVALKTQDCIEEAVLIADARRFPSALIVPNIGAMCAAVGAAAPADAAARRAFIARGDVVAAVQKAVDAVNAGLSHFEQIKKFTLLAEGFSQTTGELTPTLKVKRRVVAEKYRDAIEAMYQ